VNERSDLSLQELLELVTSSKLADVWTALPGTVKKYDATTQRADVEIGVKNFLLGPDDKPVFESLPVVQNVRIAWPGGGAVGGWFFHVPLQAGDAVLLIFSTLDAGEWEDTGKLSNPNTTQRHTLQSAFAFPFWRAPAALPPFGGAVHLKADMIAFGGLVTQFVALAPLVTAQLNALKAAIAGAAVVAGDGGAAFKANLIAALSAWPATVAATKVRAE
jgi:hypothetical protein